MNNEKINLYTGYINNFASNIFTRSILVWEYINNQLLGYSDSFTPEIFIVKGFKSYLNKTAPASTSLISYIKNEEKELYIGRYNRYKKGDTLLVWSALGHSLVKKRFINEKKFNKKKYQKHNRNIILFIFIPIILIWITERFVTRKIKKLKK